MREKLKCVLLVDDNDDCNFFHERLLNKIKCTEEVHISQNGEEALEYLQSVANGTCARPAIIFLDINMPGMDGWDFLKEYGKLNEAFKAKIVLIMVSSSLNPDDRARALSYGFVNGFQNKFMSEESLNKVLNDYFPEKP